MVEFFDSFDLLLNLFGQSDIALFKQKRLMFDIADLLVGIDGYGID